MCFCVFVFYSATRRKDLDDEQIGRSGRRREDLAVLALVEGIQEIVVDATRWNRRRAEDLDAMGVAVSVPSNVATEALQDVKSLGLRSSRDRSRGRCLRRQRTRRRNEGLRGDLRGGGLFNAEEIDLEEEASARRSLGNLALVLAPKTASIFLPCARTLMVEPSWSQTKGPRMIIWSGISFSFKEKVATPFFVLWSTKRFL